MNPPIEQRMYFLKEETYTGSHNFFYNSSDFKSIQVLKENWKVIREEIVGLITGEEEIEVKNLNPPYLSSPDAWKNIYFYNFGWQKHSNCKRFPKTFALLQQVPDLIFAGITVLEPHSRVLPHNGETNTTIRCHLGLQVPAPLPVCGVRVGTEEQSWANGEIMMFSDAHYHTTWNESDERRFVLVFDIVRPEYAHDKHSVCANVLGALSLKFFYAKWPKLKNLPYPFISGVHRLFTSFWYVYLPLQQKLGLP
ncbi:MAG: aspartyl/asparaginyl beta-hydroxylase domain-containing protein [Chitinophagales bacterium]